MIFFVTSERFGFADMGVWPKLKVTKIISKVL